MQYQMSAEAINAICNVFASGEESTAPFATLASSFVTKLAEGSPTDLGKDWLLHRLHCILVEHQRLEFGARFMATRAFHAVLDLTGIGG